jgi:3-deoxy-D-manno-octulosonic-acid transferase
VLIAGSTHEGEENILCDVYQRLKNKIPQLLMIIAPRDPKRCLSISHIFKTSNLRTTLMSSLCESHDFSEGDFNVSDLKEDPGVILVDKMGELAGLYSICDLAFIGGSMVNKGGHNSLEAAAFSKPVLFGPDMSDFLLISKMLTDHGGARTVESPEDLESEIENILGCNQTMIDMGNKNFEVFSMNSGAVQRVIKTMEQIHIV